jgi:hypothetical protein
MLLGIYTYSSNSTENKTPNLLDNLQITARNKPFIKKKSWLSNLELGVDLKSYITRKHTIINNYRNYPLLVSIETSIDNPYIISPSLQLIQKFKLIGNDEFQIGYTQRFNILGDELLNGESFPSGFDLSLVYAYQGLSLQYLIRKNIIISSKCFKLSDNSDFSIRENYKYLCLPDEFKDVALLKLVVETEIIPRTALKLYLIGSSIIPSNDYNNIIRIPINSRMNATIGGVIKFNKLTFNPEYSEYKEFIYYGEHIRRHRILSLLGDYEYKKLNFKVSFLHDFINVLSVDYQSLFNSDKYYSNHFNIAFIYSFKANKD